MAALSKLSGTGSSVFAWERWVRLALECRSERGSLWRPVLGIFLGVGVYGWTIGYWRSPALGAYVAVKLPLVILLTVLGNAALNAVLAMLLGTGLTARMTLRLILASFASFAVIAGVLSPVTMFFGMQLGDSATDAAASSSHASLLFGHTVLVAFAGVLANLQAFRRLLELVPNPAAAMKTFFAWTAGNLFVGAQVGWVFRPYVATPGIPIQFLRDEPFDGTFYESVFFSLHRIVGTAFGAGVWLTAGLMLGLGLAWNALNAEVHRHTSPSRNDSSHPNPTP